MLPFPLLLRALTVCAVLVPAAEATGAETPASTVPGEAAYQARCAACHTGQGKDMGPTLDAMRRMSYAQIRFAVTRGKMREHARGLGREEFGALVAFVAGDSGAQAEEAPLCARRAIALEASVPGWGFGPANTRFQGDTAIDVGNVASLELAWAFGLPDVAEGRSHPVVTSDTVFVAAVSGYVFALDRETGCTKWRHTAGTPVRTPLSLGRAGPRDALFFGDVSSTVHAVDALTGAPIWTRKVGLFDASVLTGGIAQYEGTLFVPVSAFGVALAQNPEYECCKSHGAVQALDAATGEIRWTTRMTPPAEKTYLSDAGTQMWGPSGAAVWTTPTVDAERRRIYIGTGENTSTPATELSDAIVALDMETGEIAWSFQATAGDAFNMACGFRRGPSCPKEDGPDFDFGAAPVLTRLPDGRDILVAGQKSGVVHTLDADDGTVLWQTRLSDGTALGGVHWGIAVSGGRVVVPVADPEFPLPGYTPRPGVHALDLTTGEVAWTHAAERGCEFEGSRRGGGEAWPECSFFYGFSAAASATEHLAFAAALDGTAYAFSLDDGAILWSYDTVRPYETVNGVDAHGGAIDNPGIQVAGDMVFVQSGYALFGQMPGNVLLAFRLP
ncbi:MAG: PQQ-binding-like beta-propeller repeat protein [Gammaproteobacteria bacterium]|nr:PQQ-binding-like beta-propeller repeat protein [Gammaproteobacteria bacterium]